MVADAGELRRALGLILDPEADCELMALPTGAYRVGPAGDVDQFCRWSEELPGGSGIYLVLNPLRPGLAEPAKVGDVIGRKWVYIDIDPVKAAGFENESATDAEKEGTREVGRNIHDYLAGHGWPAPVLVDSGNGQAMLYATDLPNDKQVTATYSRLLKLLAEKFSCNKGRVDVKVHNANRLFKVPGTWARKGTGKDDRPHRPSKITFVPRNLERLSYEELKAAAGIEDAAPKPSLNGHAKTGPVRAHAILDQQCVRVALAEPGERNNTLNAAAFIIAPYVGAGHLDRADVEARLFDAACEAGLHQDDAGERGIRATIKSGLESGASRPVDPVPVITTVRPLQGERLTVNLATIQPRQVEWLVRNRIPKRFITVFAGRTAVGKSFVACDLIARLSTGAEIPFSGGECFTPGGTLVLSEDSPEYVLAPRLIDAGANMSRIHAMSWKAMATYNLGDTEMLGRACDEVQGGVSLVMIDPPTNFLAETDEHKNSEVRQLVMKVVEWALDRDLAVLFILHVNKQTGKGVEALNRVMGSVAWVTTARIAHTFCSDPETRDQCLWVPLKSNLGPLGKAIAYRIPKGENPVVEWVAEIDTTADEAMGHAEPRKRSVRGSVFLAELFADVDRLTSNEIYKARENTTVSKDALKEAKEEMGILAKLEYDDDGQKRWAWYWPKDARAAWSQRLAQQEEANKAEREG